MNNDDSRPLRARLLAKHAAAAPQLDARRHAVLAETLSRHSRDDQPVPASQLLAALFFPNRRLWTALAAAWVFFAILHFSQRLPSPASPTLEARTGQSAELARNNWLNRQAQLHALLR